MESIREKDSDQTLMGRLWLWPPFPYVAPFALFVLITGLANLLPGTKSFLYAAKSILTGALFCYWHQRQAEDLATKLSLGNWILAFLYGLLVLFLWVAPDGHLIQLGTNSGFDPYSLSQTRMGDWGLMAIRLAGASVVVPVMEELFWRSFLMRYLINPDFRSVPLGAFAWFSFTATALFFGLEHHRIIEGIMAGVLYNLLLIRKKNLKANILAHGITNLGLGIYVITTGSWMFW